MKSSKELKEQRERLVKQIREHELRLIEEEEKYSKAYAERVEVESYIIELDSYSLELQRDIEICKSLMKSNSVQKANYEPNIKKSELRKKIKEDLFNIDILSAMKDKAYEGWNRRNKVVISARGDLEIAKTNLIAHKVKLGNLDDEIELVKKSAQEQIEQ